MIADDRNVTTEIKLPPNLDLPFFAYGLFKPGQLSYYRLKDLVLRKSEDEISGFLKERDGLPFLGKEMEGGSGTVQGCLIYFKKSLVKDAYQRISKLEPWKLYRWEAKDTVAGISANVLFGRSPNKGGGHEVEGGDWDGSRDPFWNEALNEVSYILRSTRDDSLLQSALPLIRLQMAYTLLWCSIERLVSLRYSLGNNSVMANITELGRDPYFAKYLKRFCSRTDIVFSTRDLREKCVLDPDDPIKSINYYYQMRSNVVHRGKAALQDFSKVQKSLCELLSITKSMLSEVFGESSPIGTRHDDVARAFKMAGAAINSEQLEDPYERAGALRLADRVVDHFFPGSTDGASDDGLKTGKQIEEFRDWLSNENQSWNYSEAVMQVLTDVEFPNRDHGDLWEDTDEYGEL